MEDARDRIEEARAQLTELDYEVNAWLGRLEGVDGGARDRGERT